MILRLLTRRPLFAILLLCAPLVATTYGQVSDVSVDSVELGIKGQFRVGRFTQVRLQLISKQPLDDVRLELEVPDGEGVPSLYVDPKVALNAGPNMVTSHVKFGRVDNDVTVRIRNPAGP